jgi:5-hydroxyisourate hydrolase
MSRITTHVLDTALGMPAEGVPIMLERIEADGTHVVLGRGVTDGDGRLRDLAPPGAGLHTGTHRITFDTGTYFTEQQLEGFYPTVIVHFTVEDALAHYHVPLLLSPFGYSTYRGS